LDRTNGVLKDVFGENFLSLFDGVIENDTEGCGASKRIDATQALPIGRIRLRSRH
jgi:hypothetical protein